MIPRIPLMIDQLHVVVDGQAFTRLIAVSGILIGTVDLIHSGRVSASIRQLYVDPSFREKGVGSALVLRCCEIARESGCRSLGFNLDKDNEGTRAFYHRLGFIDAYQYEDGSSVMTAVFGKGVADV